MSRRTVRRSLRATRVLLTLLLLLAACERSGPFIPVASTAGPAVIVIETEDGGHQWAGPLVIEARTQRILIGSDMTAQEWYCDPETADIVAAMIRVSDPDSEEVLWARQATDFSLCPDDRLLWTGDELRRLEPDEPWPDEITIEN